MTALHLQSAIGLFALVAIAWIFSENRRAFPWRVAAAGLALQLVLALAFLGTPWAREGLGALNGVVEALQKASLAGTSFVFGYTGGAPAPFEVTNPAGMVSLAFQILPLVLLMAALSAMLWHWRVLPAIVRGFSFLLERTLGIGGAVGVGCAANVFLGMIEAPLLIRPYLEKLTRSELFVVLTCGLATVAGTVLVLFAVILGPVVPDALGHILVASLLSLPASVVIAKVMIPGSDATPAEKGIGAQYRSTMDAVARGTQDGIQIWLGIVAMLVVMVALVALANSALTLAPQVEGAPLTFERILGWLFAPFMWLIGVPWEEAADAGALMGVKTVLNEFVAYLNLAALPPETLSPRTELIMLYAMCGFANLGSAGMMIAGVSAMVPSRRDEVVQLSMRAIIAGTLATMMTGAVVGSLPVFGSGG